MDHNKYLFPAEKIYKAFHFLLVILLCIFSIKSTAQTIDPNSQISILTVSPGKELFNAFGHSGIRINDTINNKDYVFNYGIFNFRAPNFYTNFMKGKLLYSLGVQRTSGFINSYKFQNRQVIEQIVSLPETENKKIIEFLVENYKPENRKYYYDFFYDNCSSKIRDVFENELEGFEFNFDPNEEERKSFRQMLDIYTHDNGRKWADFGMDLILGLPSDKNCNKRDQMFLPELLCDNLIPATFDGNKLLSDKKIILPHSKPAVFKDLRITPLIATSLLFIIALLISLSLSTRKKLQKRFDQILFAILGIAGILFLCMWLFTDHFVCHKNMNMLWANPLYIPALIFTFNKKRFWFWLMILVIVLLLTFPVFPQQFHIAFIPIFLTIILRSFLRYRSLN